MKIYCINLKRAKERRDFQIGQAKRLNLDITFVDAVDYHDISKEELSQAADCWTRPIAGKDVGCFLSHKSCWEIISENTEPSMIIEDDIVFSTDIKKSLDAIAAVPFPKNRVYDLEYSPSRHTLEVNPDWDIKAHTATRIYINKAGAGCYILTPYVAAQLLGSIGSFAMVDSWLWTRPWIEQIQIEPCPAMQSLYFETHGDTSIPKSNEMHEIYDQTRYLKKKYLRLKLTIDQLKGGVLRGLIWGKKRNLKISLKSFSS
jgi:GR25 family glycosyltransferase involved in LPS biosynthesis